MTRKKNNHPPPPKRPATHTPPHTHTPVPASVSPDLSRRMFIAGGAVGLGSVALWAMGCASNRSVSSTRSNPGGRLLPEVTSPGPARGKKTDRLRELLNDYTSRHPSATPTPPATIQPPQVSSPGVIRAVPRARWAQAKPIGKRLNPMNGIRRITVHHEGWKPFWNTDAPATAARLELIRQSHLERLHAGDIGYHFVVDRAGRLWEGRSLAHQGAHVKNYNPHNVGIMVLGNFDRQRPNDAQLSTLRRTVGQLALMYRVRSREVRSHQEFNPTQCPGRYLQPQMNGLRQMLG